jgi:hypothetical protein
LGNDLSSFDEIEVCAEMSTSLRNAKRENEGDFNREIPRLREGLASARVATMDGAGPEQEWLTSVNDQSTELSLLGKSIGVAGARALAAALEGRSALTSLNLEGQQYW